MVWCIKNCPTVKFTNLKSGRLERIVKKQIRLLGVQQIGNMETTRKIDPIFSASALSVYALYIL